MNGDVLFFKKTNSFISRIIAKLTKSNYTHVGLIVDCNLETNTITIIESNRFIATKITEVELNDNTVIFTFDNKTSSIESKILEFANKKIGVKYDYLQIVGLIISLLLKKQRFAYFNTTNRFICSELIDRAYIYAGVKRYNTDNIGYLTPSELIDAYNLKEHRGIDV
ncbi:YiiX/YebB-like N1pC/P60 family cysteine hydrolase [Halobacillus rhizosphaerae]|uniref:YiiX/YebB-like N1pC/P60 family cysteine hydrolase n=1 Tax=Halobacillus rhizosphaerae TaxID=3064889 RepID=UPI00398B5E8A